MTSKRKVDVAPGAGLPGHSEETSHVFPGSVVYRPPVTNQPAQNSHPTIYIVQPGVKCSSIVYSNSQIVVTKQRQHKFCLLVNHICIYLLAKPRIISGVRMSDPCANVKNVVNAVPFSIIVRNISCKRHRKYQGK